MFCSGFWRFCFGSGFGDFVLVWVLEFWFCSRVFEMLFWRFCFGPSLEILFWSELKRFKFGLGWERFWFGLGLGGFGLF